MSPQQTVPVAQSDAWPHSYAVAEALDPVQVLTLATQVSPKPPPAVGPSQQTGVGLDVEHGWLEKQKTAPGSSNGCTPAMSGGAAFARHCGGAFESACACINEVAQAVAQPSAMLAVDCQQVPLGPYVISRVE